MLKYVFLGLVQGITEFLPISSSAHLLILQHILKMHGEELPLIVFLHLATLLALILFFIKELLALINKPKILLYIFIVTLVTGLAAFFAKDFFEGLFASIRLVSSAMFINGIILLFTKKFSSGAKNLEQINLKDALLLGLVQAISIIPGISRSGITITFLLSRKFDKESAFKFSFLAAIPAIIGANILELKNMQHLNFKDLDLSAGFLVSFIVGLSSLAILRQVAVKGKLYYFAYYCFFFTLWLAIFIK